MAPSFAKTMFPSEHTVLETPNEEPSVSNHFIPIVLNTYMRDIRLRKGIQEYTPKLD